MFRWFRRRAKCIGLRYHYVCPNGHTPRCLPNYDPGYCHYCGAELVKVETRRCPVCGEIDSPLSTFCKCGHKLRDEVSPLAIFEIEYPDKVVSQLDDDVTRWFEKEMKK